MIDYTTLTEDQLYGVVEAAKAELGRRQSVVAFEQQVADLYTEARESGAVTTPAQGGAWVQPTGAHDAYAAGDETTHHGKEWISLVTPNVWEPGDTSNPLHYTLWREKGGDPGTGDTGVPLWSGLGVDYKTGDVREHNGELYEARQDHTSQPGWAPDVVPALWKKAS